jgi:hypothetical protein
VSSSHTTKWESVNVVHVFHFMRFKAIETVKIKIMVLGVCYVTTYFC